MMTLSDLDPETRAHALVGRFLSVFAQVEHQVTDALALLLDLDETQRAALLEGMPVGQKFKALKEIAPGLPPAADRAAVAKLASILLKANTEVRLHVAHKRFGVGTKDLAVFSAGLANHELSAWTTDEFCQRIEVVKQTMIPLLDLYKVLAKDKLDRHLKDLMADAAQKIFSELSVSGDETSPLTGEVT